MIIKINLGINADYSLKYELYNHRVATRIWERFKVFDQQFVSRTEFHNFGETHKQIEDKMYECVKIIKDLCPGVFVDGDDLNVLHKNFPDMMKTATGKLRSELSKFNYYLHHLEDFQRMKTDDSWFLVAAQNDDGEDLQDSDYDMFNPVVMKDHLYMNYPHIGKHLLEIFYDKDLSVPKEHICPTSILKNSLFCWLGKSGNPIRRYFLTNAVKDYCKQIQHKLPYEINDKRLAIGHICLGKLLHEPDLLKIKQYQYVHSVESI